ncbi:uncharacterized protein M421DRAFT_411424 [Didymella exigua CBS 183.55]|uniref:Uncharacterized protein n=1 Tax=Didymella exigua CBS 183.55 TaxID=1150837 RepID=A0A6A5R446_9PLEO|nr:uncharacterized protein M421DRAFT_411424 [Didymella exigua CBS 183.55]KAF1922442.1 hypothetical protein M421DRAFT_411424 [Didymella exigua CBS 183.55]
MVTTVKTCPQDSSADLHEEDWLRIVVCHKQALLLLAGACEDKASNSSHASLGAAIRLLSSSVQVQNKTNHEATKSEVSSCLETIGHIRSDLRQPKPSKAQLGGLVSPKLYHGNKISLTITEPEHIESKRALNLLTDKAKSLKLAIFIDDVDDFEGNHSDMSQFLRSLASDHIKLIISSRLIDACLEIFRDCPPLRLQDLTVRDMGLFVEGELSSHTDMVALLQTTFNPESPFRRFDIGQNPTYYSLDDTCGPTLTRRYLQRRLV